MIPDTVRESAYGTAWAFRMRNAASPLSDFERGGVALSDVSQGVRGYDWTAYYNTATDQIFVYREDLGLSTQVPLTTQPGLTRIALAFDQNMRPVLAWVGPDGCYLWYYRADISDYGTQAVPGAFFPCLTLDERRPEGVSESDVLLSYTRDNNLYCRVQREGYAVEHDLYTPVPHPELLAFGMTKELRLQWRLRP